jgi:hypothetical protein
MRGKKTRGVLPVFYKTSSQINWLLIIVFISFNATAANQVRQLPEKGKFSITPELGTFYDREGKLVDGDATVGVVGSSGLPQIGGIVVSPGLTAKAEDQGFDDAFDTPVIVGLTVNYGLSSSSEVFVRLQYTQASADTFDLLTFRTAGFITAGPVNGDPPAFAPIPVAIGDVVEAEFDDYEEYGIDLGYRHFFSTGNHFKPFVSISGGVRIVDALDLEYIAPTGASIGKGRFYDDSTVLSAGLGVGFRYEMSPTVAVGLETGVNYQGQLDDEDLGGGGLDDLNDGGRRWQIPLYLGVNIQL